MELHSSTFSKNYKYKYHFREQWNKLISIDKVRVGKLLEMFQYSAIAYILVVIFTTILNKTIFSKPREEIAAYSTLALLLNTFFEIFLIILIMFYIQKIILLFPSLPAIFIPGFKEHTTLSYVIHTALIYFFLEIITNLKYRMEIIHDRLLTTDLMKTDKKIK
jgi:hypothetical protein